MRADIMLYIMLYIPEASAAARIRTLPAKSSFAVAIIYKVHKLIVY